MCVGIWHAVPRCFLLSGVLLLMGCGGDEYKNLPKKHIQYLVEATLPPFVNVDRCELEPVNKKVGEAVVNFKIVVVPKESLYLSEKVVDGVPKVTLLKLVHEKKEKVAIYGSVNVRHRDGKWILGPLTFQQESREIGDPIGYFDASSYVVGSAESIAALERQSNNAKLARIAMEKQASYKEAEIVCMQRVKDAYLSRIQKERRDQEAAVKAAQVEKELQNLRERQLKMRTKLLESARNESKQLKSENPVNQQMDAAKEKGK